MADFIPMFGYSPNRDGTDEFLASLAKPTLAQAGPDLALDETRDVFLGSYLLKCDPAWKRGAQKIGSCVGWGWALSCDILAACDIHVRSEAEVYGGRVLEASVYAFSRVEVRGQRNLGGDGSYGGAAAKAVTKYGTLHYGIDYGGDKFTDNSGTREKEWGRDGVPDRLEKYAANHKVSSVALVMTFEDAAKAIQNGYPVAVCSMQGFSMSQREGYLTPMGSWAHCMMFAGVRWKPYPALLCVNSWGDCYSGDVDKTLPVQFQRSAGWVRAETCTRMLKGEDSFALSGYSGFAPRKLEGNWLEGIL
ncbi:MAG: hypothetical protein EBR82_41265 [Caulobacteraceae bacterium]|nr:hypothetical protein [Caulobacteraceae bacterium]